MSSDRLTRQELSWLLAQEARSAAEMLRKGVTGRPAEPSPAPPTDVTSTLDVLDDAMRTLASLHAGGPSFGRRGRIDVAALLLELSPSASVSIEPGAGTEVFGDEMEFRRIFQVLLSVGDTSAPVTVRREGESIRITVTLGPDSSGAARMEQAWLHRMAVRHGGVLALEGGVITLDLPADADNEKKEMEELRRELAAAQEQGETYARELASMFTRSDTTVPPPSVAAVDDGFSPLVRVARTLSAELRPARASSLPALVTDLARFGRLDPREPALPCDVAEIGKAIQPELRRLATARGVELRIEGEGACRIARAWAEALALFLGTYAVESSPKGSTVVIALQRADDGLSVTVTDAGPGIPLAARTKLLALEETADAAGRGSPLPLFFADALVRHAGGTLRIEDAPREGAEVVGFLPVSTVIPQDHRVPRA